MTVRKPLRLDNGVVTPKILAEMYRVDGKKIRRILRDEMPRHLSNKGEEWEFIPDSEEYKRAISALDRRLGGTGA